MYADKLPPHDLAAEESVLGSILVDTDRWPEVQVLLEAESFYGEKNRCVWAALESCQDRGVAINQVTVAHALNQADRLDVVGGPAYLSHLIATVATPLHAAHYAAIVRECALHRKRIKHAGEIAAAAYEGKENAEALEELLALNVETAREGFQPYREISDEFFNDFADQLERVGKARGLLTGLTKLDGLLDGFAKKRLYLLAGRPGMGKSDLARNIAERITEHGGTVAYVSLEMPAADILQRSIYARAGLDKQSDKPLSTEQKNRLMDSLGALDALKLWIEDAPELKIADIRARTMALMAKTQTLDLLIIDHLGHIGDRPSEKAYERTSAISRRVFALAKTLNIPILGLVQLKREVDERPGLHMPRLSDLRDTGRWEEDAYAVMLLWRFHYYREDRGEEDGAFLQDNPAERNVLHILIAKNRGGPCGQTKLYYNPATGQIENLETRKGRGD